MGSAQDTGIPSPYRERVTHEEAPRSVHGSVVDWHRVQQLINDRGQTG
jgi:hypothetical protein